LGKDLPKGLKAQGRNCPSSFHLWYQHLLLLPGLLLCPLLLLLHHLLLVHLLLLDSKLWPHPPTERLLRALSFWKQLRADTSLQKERKEKSINLALLVSLRLSYDRLPLLCLSASYLTHPLALRRLAPRAPDMMLSRFQNAPAFGT
jgi:hypothetical protein